MRLSECIQKLVDRCPVCKGTGRYDEPGMCNDPLVCNRSMCGDILRIRERVIEMETVLDACSHGTADALPGNQPANERQDSWIKVEDCVHGHLYRVAARNFSVGLYDAARRLFTGARLKFSDEFLYSEYHWDADPNHGTAKPLEDLGPLPGQLSADGNDEDDARLLRFLQQLEKVHSQ